MIETLFFALLGIVAVAAAIGMVIARHSVHSALLLVVNLFCVALMYLTLSAEFVTAVQIIVYAGAIMVLFLFVITLLNPASERRLEGLRTQAFAGVALAAVLLIEVAAIAWSGITAGSSSQTPPPLSAADADNVRQIGESLFTSYVLPFELTSVLLLVAIVGATVLGKARL